MASRHYFAKLSLALRAALKAVRDALQEVIGNTTFDSYMAMQIKGLAGNLNPWTRSLSPQQPTATFQKYFANIYLTPQGWAARDQMRITMTRTYTICAAALGFTLSLMVTLPALAQGQFSQAGAQAIINTRDWNRLLAYGQAWARAEPNNATAWYVIGRAYGLKYYQEGLQRPADAIAPLHRALELDPRMLEAWGELGLADMDVNNWRESVSAFEHATQLAPQDTHGWDFLTAAYMHTHQFQQAAEAAANVERNAKTASDWFQAGTDYYAVAPYYQPTPMYQKSKAAFQKSLQLAPQNAAAWTNLGTTEQALGNYDAALADYQKGVTLGNQLGGRNYDSLLGDIKACIQWRQTIDHSTGNTALTIVNYNQHCAKYTGEIRIIFVP